MCTPKIKTGSTATPAAAPASPLPTADNLKMRERTDARDGQITANTARSRRTLRTDLKIVGSTGANIPKMG